MNSIETKNINIAYGNVNIVEDLNLEIPKGKITTIIGANGCGKSTIIKLMLGLYPNYTGGIYVGETSVNELSDSVRKNLFSALFQDSNQRSRECAHRHDHSIRFWPRTGTR